MAALADSMPPLLIPQPLLAEWGAKWSSDVNPDTGRRKPKGGERFDKQQSMNFPLVFDQTFGNALAAMLGGIPVVEPNANALVSPQPDCVEVGSTRIIGGIRPQNFDAAYRPDGPRVVFDSKTLNDLESVKKIGKIWSMTSPRKQRPFIRDSLIALSPFSSPYQGPRWVQPRKRR